MSIVLGLLLLLWAPTAAANDEALWSLLRDGGKVLLMRHAVTDPGAGDPPGFTLEDCATQRNLSAAGRQDARRVGDAFRARGVPVARVLSSRWCRCLETARIAFGHVEPWPALDSIFEERNREAEQTAAIRALAGKHPTTGGNLILVTHGVNIAALIGIVPAPAEMIVLTPDGRDGFRVAGRLRPATTPD